MGKLVHTSRNTITRVEGQVRKAFIEGFEEPVFYAVHGGIKQFYKLEPKEEHATTFDHIIALRFPRGRKMNPARHSSTIFLNCPCAQSIIGCIHIEHNVEIEEEKD